jgi:hypothetical protein
VIFYLLQAWRQVSQKIEMDHYDKGYSIQQTNKLKMAMKKPTKSDIKAGRVYRCGNCDALCDGDISYATQAYVMGRPQTESTTYYCDLACGRKHCRDKQRPNYEKRIENRKGTEPVLKEVLECFIHEGKKSKTLFQAIKMFRQEIKSFTMLLSGESTLHIMKVEFFKLSEAAMELAELIADEEDTEFNKLAKEFDSIGPVTEIKAQNLAMYARCMAEDEKGSLSLWFN